MRKLLFWGLTVLTLCGEGVLSRANEHDIVFLLDASGDITKKDWNYMLSFVKKFEQRAGFGKSRFGVISYAEKPSLDIKLSDFYDSSAFERALSKLRRKHGKGHVPGALESARTKMFTSTAGDRADAANAIILMTHNYDASDDRVSYLQAAKARRKGIKLVVIGIGPKVLGRFIKTVASRPGWIYGNGVYRFSQLNGILDMVIDSVLTSSQGKRLWSCGFEDNERSACPIISESEDSVRWMKKSHHGLSGELQTKLGQRYLELISNRPTTATSRRTFYFTKDREGLFCVSFYYKIGELGKLQLLTWLHHREWIFWKKHGVKNDRNWHHAEVTIKIESGQPGGFRGVFDTGYSSGICVDLINLNKGVCSKDM